MLYLDQMKLLGEDAQKVKHGRRTKNIFPKDEEELEFRKKVSSAQAMGSLMPWQVQSKTFVMW